MMAADFKQWTRRPEGAAGPRTAPLFSLGLLPYYEPTPRVGGVQGRKSRSASRRDRGGDETSGSKPHDARAVGAEREPWPWALRDDCGGRALFYLWLFMETSSIHGLAHLTVSRRATVEYVLWAACVVLAVAGCLAISLRMLSRYEENPTVVSMERDYKAWNTSFPAATICLFDNYDPKAIRRYVDATKVEDKEALEQFLKKLISVSYDSFSDVEVVPGNPLTPDKYQEFVFNYTLQPDFSHGNISHSDSSDTDEVTPNFTERGLCFTYNSAVAIYNNYKYWQNNSWEVFPNLPRKEFFGNPLSGDRFTNWFLGKGVKFYVHATREAADTARAGLHLAFNRAATVRLLALAIHTTPAVRALRLSQRRCRLPTESNLRLTPVYSFNLCRADCRRRLARRLCGCVPYFYRRIDETPVCNETQMRCLAENEGTLIKLVKKGTNKKISCGCLPLCDEVNYATEFAGLNAWTGSFVKWGIVTYPLMRLKRDIIFGFTDLLVAVGGTAGLFLGCSVLSFIEILYFFTLRLFLHMIKKKREK